MRDLAFAACFFHDLPERLLVDEPDRPRKLRLGGMALRNGLLVHGPTPLGGRRPRRRRRRSASAPGASRACRRPTASPGVRGVARLGEAFAVIPLVKRALPEAKLPFENAGVIGARRRGVASAGALVRRRFGGAGGEVAASVLSLAPAMFALRGGELAAYHGVEHKAIAAYEAPDDRDAADAAKEHDRCGSHLVAPMLAANVAGALVLKRVLERPDALAGGAARRRVDGGRRRGLRVVRAPRGQRRVARAAPAGLRDPAADRNARAGRAPAGGRTRRVAGDPPGRDDTDQKIAGSRP